MFKVDDIVELVDPLRRTWYFMKSDDGSDRFNNGTILRVESVYLDYVVVRTLDGRASRGMSNDIIQHIAPLKLLALQAEEK